MTETHPAPAPVGMRERARRAVLAELTTVAMELFLEHGYDATTVDQIAAAAGMSQRTFFRYFPSKDAVLGQALAASGQALAAAVASRPVTETPWVALHEAFAGLVELMLGDPRSLAMTRVMLQAPELGGQHADKETSWRTALAEVLLPRLQHAHPEAPGDDLLVQAAALAGAGMACLTTAQSRWVDSEGARPLPQLLQVAMTALAPVD